MDNAQKMRIKLEFRLICQKMNNNHQEFAINRSIIMDI